MRNLNRLSRHGGRWVFPAGIALLVLSAAGVAADDTRESPPSRSLPVTSRAPSSPSPPSTPPPSTSPSSPGSSSPSPGYGGGGRHGRPGGYHRHPYHHGSRFYGFSYYWPYSRFYWDYYRPYYPWGLVWYPAHSSDTRLGALDLDIKPWKVEVYVDGEYVGRAGRFDGYPGYLWLTEGSHQLVFYREGWETVARRVTVSQGPVRRLKIKLSEGPSTPPEELFQPARRLAEARPRPDPPPAAASAPREKAAKRDAALDVRGAPGRFRLDIAPPDASVYLDGRFLGSAEELSRLHAGMLVEAGEHFLDVQRPGYRAERVSFSVEAGDETEVKVALSPGESPGG